MYLSRSHSLIGLLVACSSAAVGCGDAVDVFDFTTPQAVAVVSSGGAVSVPGTGGSGSLVDPVALGGATAAYREGGYGGWGDITWGIVDENGQQKIVDQFEVCNGVSPDTTMNAFSLSYWEPANCRAGSLCSSLCQTDADCELTLPGPLTSACEAIPGSSAKMCVLPCDADADCLDGMVCGEVNFAGRSCVLADTPWAPGCPHFCMDTGYDTPELLCGRDADCCDGLSCSPNGQCQARECLPSSWECSAAGVPCCDGLTCDIGSCR